MLVNLKLLIEKQLLKKYNAEGKFIKQSGGRGKYGHVWIELMPNEVWKRF